LLRRENIVNYSLLGPPDLCYILKERTSKSMISSKKIQQGYFHYVYGVQTNSSATIAAYLQ
jgi:hypothetical protein